MLCMTSYPITKEEDTFRKWEEERWEKEIEFQEKRRREDREHELRLFQMLGQISKPWESRYPTNYPTSPYNEF